MVREVDVMKMKNKQCCEIEREKERKKDGDREKE